MVTIARRKLLAAFAGAAAWPFVARAQQAAMPVVGYLNPQSLETYGEPMRAFRQGLKETGYVEGENVAIEYRWADNRYDRLSALAAELVRHQVAVIVATGGPLSALAAKAATTAIPVVFNVGDDPVEHGLVASLAHPGGNLTGVNFLAVELAAKRLELLRELAPAAARVAVLVNPASEANTQMTLREVETVAHRFNLQIQVLRADTSGEIDAAFQSIGRERSDALFVAVTPFFITRRVQLVQLAALHRIPAAYGSRDFAEVDGLMSYGASLEDAYRQVGIYTGRILKGAKPADLPVVQATRLELVINHQTARMLDVTVPDKLLATADEVIE
jgi:putative tryptophan/tyrosine transport system substrate-binding protein